MPANTNKPKRFNLIPRLILMPGAWEIGGDKVRKLTEVAMEYKEDEKGMYVLASECDDIVAENERLKSQVAGLQLVRGYEHYVADLVQRLADQNEQLRKAGEMLFECIEPDIDDIGYNYGFKLKHAEARDAWLAAKEGGRK